MTVQRKWAIGYLAAFIVMLILNYSSGSNIGNVADDNQSIIQPAGFAFSIWGLIYILLLIWIIRLFFQKDWENTAVYHLKYWPIINFLLNGIWIIVFTQQLMLLSVIVIFALLITLIIMHMLISKADYHWFDRLPLSIYFSWVTVASIVNAFAFTNSNNVEGLLGMTELTWTIIMLAAAALIGVITALYFKDWLYPLVLIWPFFGIYTENNSDYMSLDITLLAASIALITVSLTVLINKKKNSV